MSAHLEIQLIAVIVAIACSIPGVFLVLRKMAMMSDAISHTILLGIVTAFFIVSDLNSPFLIFGAALMGIVTVYLVELLNKTRLMAEDSAIGIIFPLLFSIAIIIISKYAGSIHLDVDSVLLGELAFAPFNRMFIYNIDVGARAIYSMGSILILNIILVTIFFKELKLATFDPGLAAILGFSPSLIHYGLMTSVSITAVAAFEAVGSILVIAFMIGPAISAYLITDDLRKMLILSGVIGIVNAILGFHLAVLFDVSIAGSISLVIGISFMLIFVFAPERGIITVVRRRRIQAINFAAKSLLFRIYNHEVNLNKRGENAVENIFEHLNWKKDFLNSIIRKLKRDGLIVEKNGILKLTKSGQKSVLLACEDVIAI